MPTLAWTYLTQVSVWTVSSPINWVIRTSNPAPGSWRASVVSAVIHEAS